MTALRSLVMRSDSVSIASQRMVQLESGAGYLACVPLKKPHFARESCLRQRRKANLTPVAQRFVAVLRAVAGEMRRSS